MTLLHFVCVSNTNMSHNWAFSQIAQRSLTRKHYKSTACFVHALLKHLCTTENNYAN